LLVCLLITLPLAAASYRWIEKPVLDRFARSPKRTPEPVVT
jgi:peptidoglycan/LPS O-acetylase OafA/YrhL